MDITDVGSVGDISINDSNLLQCMGIIEQRTSSILSNYYRCKIRDSPDKANDQSESGTKEEVQNKKGSKSRGIKDFSTALNPPIFMDDSSDENSCDEGDGSRLLSIEELKARVQNRINQPRKKFDLPPSRRSTRRRTPLLS